VAAAFSFILYWRKEDNDASIKSQGGIRVENKNLLIHDKEGKGCRKTDIIALTISYLCFRWKMFHKYGIPGGSLPWQLFRRME
jgi:hypothetical protein